MNEQASDELKPEKMPIGSNESGNTDTPDNSQSNSESFQGTQSRVKGEDNEGGQQTVYKNYEVSATVEVSDPKIKEDFIVQNIPIEQVTNLFLTQREEAKSEVQHSLYKDTDRIRTDYIPKFEFTEDELSVPLDLLKNDHLLFIGCSSKMVAFDAAYALIKALGITELEQSRTYDIQERLDEGAHVSVRPLLFKEEADLKRVAVIVNAFSDSAQAVVSSLIYDQVRTSKYVGLLKASEIFLLCIVPLEYINERISEHKLDYQFLHWKVSYLHYLLKSEFPDKYPYYEQKILSQQKEGYWDKDETKLSYQVKSYIDNSQLEDKIDRPKDFIPVESADTIFKDKEFIEKIVVYVATYFPGATPSEFCGLVEALLGDREVLATTPKFIYDNERDIQWSDSLSVRPIVEIWRDYKDSFIRKRLTISSRDMVNVIDFAEFSLRDSLLKYLNNFRSLYLKDQLNTLLSEGYLFYPSSRIAGNMVKLTAKIAAEYPDEYSKDWLVAIIRNLRDCLQPDQKNSHQNENRFFQFLEKAPFNQATLGYSRISELIREMIKIPQTKELVHRCLSDLMRLDYHDAVFNLVKRLRFTQDFDGFYWMKQLFDRGDPNIRFQTFNYLYNNLREGNISIYETLGRLESWLPDADRVFRKYPQSTRFALRLLIKYCLETAIPEHAEWQTEYPLFVFVDEEAANRNLDQLVKWLLHPAMRQTPSDLESDPVMKNLLNSLGVEKNPVHLLGGLIAKWSFILVNPAQATSEDGNSTTLKLSAAELLDMLLEKVAANTNEEQQRDLIASWNLISRDLLYSMSTLECSTKDRNQVFPKWHRITLLTEMFNKITLEAKAVGTADRS